MGTRLRRGIGLVLAVGALTWLGYAIPRSMETAQESKPPVPSPSRVPESFPVTTVAPPPVPSSTSDPTASPTALVAPSSNPQPAPTLTLYFTSTVAMRSPIHSPTVAIAAASPVASPSPVPPLPVVDLPPCSPPPVSSHLWLARPFPSEANDWASAYYPYGSTAGGQYLIHHGVDIGNPEGTPVLAAGAGTVFYAGGDRERVFGPQPNFYGRLVIVTMDQEYHGQSLFTLYGHLSSIAVQTGQRVEVGQKLGEVGATGIAIGPHLHFEVRVTDAEGYGATRNPELWLRPHPGRGLVAGRVLDENGRPVPEAPLVVYPAEDPDHAQREGWTYAHQGLNPDEEWFENLVLGDVPAGEWAVVAYMPGQRLRQRVTVRPGEISWVCLQPPNSPTKACP